MTIDEDYSYDYQYCNPEDFDSEWGNCDEWQTKTSIAKTGEYYIAIVGYPAREDFDDQAYDCTDSAFLYCSDEGDYYKAAKRYCKISGGRLATVAELESLRDQIGFQTGNFYWTSEEASSDYAYYINEDHSGYTSKADSAMVLCIGQ